MDSVTMPPSLPFKNRKIGLILLGSATVFMGCCSALFVPLMLLGSTLAAKSATSPRVTPNLWPVIAVYGGMAVALIWLGVGSILARRWARALLAIWSWSWFIMGLFSLVGIAIMAPHIAAIAAAGRPPGQPSLPEGARIMIMAVPIIVTGVFFVALPLIWGLFYGGKNVKATCEALDPHVRWTDRCPLPVLAVTLWLIPGTLGIIIMPAFHSVAPFFGVFLSGLAGTAFYLLLGCVWAYCAWSFYRLERRGWWALVIALLLLCLSQTITYSRHDLGEMYAAMGYSAAQMAPMQPFMNLAGRWMRWWILLCTIPFIGYLLYIRRFFNERPSIPG